MVNLDNFRGRKSVLKFHILTCEESVRIRPTCEELVRFFSDVKYWYQIFTEVKKWCLIFTDVSDRISYHIYYMTLAGRTVFPLAVAYTEYKPSVLFVRHRQTVLTQIV